jgi:N utilization substance protein B
MTNSRTIGRTKALQVLFAYEFHELPDPSQVAGLVDLAGEEFTLQLISEFLTHRTNIDALLTTQLAHWDLARVNLVDRNILRLGVLELILKTADKAVIINEYIELAKIWGTEKSGGFVNGILDAVASNIVG